MKLKRNEPCCVIACPHPAETLIDSYPVCWRHDSAVVRGVLASGFYPHQYAFTGNHRPSRHCDYTSTHVTMACTRKLDPPSPVEVTELASSASDLRRRAR